MKLRKNFFSRNHVKRNIFLIAFFIGAVFLRSAPSYGLTDQELKVRLDNLEALLKQIQADEKTILDNQQETFKKIDQVRIFAHHR